MTISGLLIRKCTAAALAITISAPLAEARTPPQEETQPQQAQSAPAAESQGQPAIAGEGRRTENIAALPDAPDAAPRQSAGSGGQSSSSQSNSSQGQNNPSKPVGTAAAPAEGGRGVMASRPAGAVIAPAKQRRVRTILIQVGVIAGACVAIGTVVALSHSSPSQPRMN
jgi:hypothetical protein